LECPIADEECSLSDILEPTEIVAPKYFLTPKAAAGILRRLDKRKRIVPTKLRRALEITRDRFSDACKQPVVTTAEVTTLI
jgi:hypothetical protein